MESVPVISGLRLQALPDHRTNMLSALKLWVNGVRAYTGCINVITAQQVEDRNVIYAVVVWENETALEGFRASQVAKALARPLVPHAAKIQTTRFRADEVIEDEAIEEDAPAV